MSVSVDRMQSGDHRCHIAAGCRSVIRRDDGHQNVKASAAGGLLRAASKFVGELLAALDQGLGQ